MKRILITGGGGMIGQKIAHLVAAEGLQGQPVSKVTLFDLAVPADGAPHDLALQGELGDTALLDEAIDDLPDVVIHLAAVVSAGAERDFDLGWRVNVRDMWAMLDRLRKAQEAGDGSYRPRVVFASSAAVYGGPMPDIIPDDFQTEPQGSYGNQKIVGEKLVNDYSRKGFIDGVSLRLPTISVRPGKPNAAASSCFSDIMREPLNGKEARLPVPESTVHAHASPRSAARFFVHAATLDTDRLDGIRAIVPPSFSCSIEEQIEALRAHAGSDAVQLIRREPDPDVSRLVLSWPKAFEGARARALGFVSEESYDEILKAYVEDDLGKS